MQLIQKRPFDPFFIVCYLFSSYFCIGALDVHLRIYQFESISRKTYFFAKLFQKKIHFYQKISNIFTCYFQTYYSFYQGFPKIIYFIG